MALTLKVDTDKILDLEGYRAIIDTQVDFNDIDCIMASAIHLKALANNRNFLIERLNSELENPASFQSDNSYTAPTLLLGGGKNYLVRANVWEPPSRIPESREAEDKLFLYRVPHDHNFSFLTVGYCGPGYETSIYEYEPDRVMGYPGEQVDLHFLEHTSLPEGKVMFYRASKDVHSQEHAKEFSISLNLLVNLPETSLINQYLFNLEERAISSYVQSAGSGRVMLCRLAKYFGDEHTTTLLEAIALRHSSERVRSAAYESIAAREPHLAQEIWRRALNDAHPGVRRAAVQAMEKKHN